MSDDGKANLFLHSYSTTHEPAVKFELFIDLQCPYSKVAFNNLKDSIPKHYGKKVDFSITVTALGFHYQAFEALVGGMIAQKVSGKRSTFLDYISTVFEHQESIMNAACTDKNPAQIKQAVADLACNLDGVTQEAYTAERNGEDGGWKYVVQANRMCKYAQGRGVGSTPSMIVDGFLVPNTESKWGLEEWKAKIDPFLA
mmetsp:Transcript_46791/g.92072  ORF Transcript_46791/g.92072 Transcript_46791/m.92072 type:complete len:199 (-) Transcript_46791:261-857(-)|eukprot:CAMPEP_0175140542 /NCGR_PEP_ID=MMETSP0087-20121206/11578_1 /TAXON_ID=136419 /ORGANISM="Unknown Unknown, Strain D1" /LENGTH=198 /DNA_ID=CAMNT_0016423799 /DNA_START=96 /DNA_END=692 /DNA_ORIENTATION=+